MSHRAFTAAALAMCAVFCGPTAQAATTVYPASIFQNTGVANPNRLLGNTPLTASRFQRGDSIGLNYGTDITKFTLNIEITQLQPRTTWLSVQFGRLVAGVFTPAAGAGLLNPLGLVSTILYAPVLEVGTLWINTDAFEASCDALGGCNSFRIGNSTFSQNGARFDVSVVGATPEPSVWALMILAFAGLAARLKQVRAGRRLAFASKLRPC